MKKIISEFERDLVQKFFAFIMASSSTRFVVLSGYKLLLKTAARAFAQDAPALSAARVEIRSHFEQNRDESDTDNLAEQIRGIDEVIEFLEQNVVQAKLKPETGDYEVKFEDWRPDDT